MNFAPAPLIGVSSLDRWYQEEAVDTLLTYFDTHGGTAEDGRPVEANPLIALPTGTGKSFVIAKFLQRVFWMFPQTRVIMGTHVKELIAQNAKQLMRVWPNAPLGIYSAGLKQKDFLQPIVFGGVKSLVRAQQDGASMLGFRDLMVIDEAHLVGPSADSSYGELILQLKALNPYLKIIGLSATIYRMGMGLLTNGPIFTDIAYNLCDIEGFRRLMAEGYLSPIFPKKPRTELDVSNVGLSSTGDFNDNQLQAAVDQDSVTYEALCELVEQGQQRRSWLIFASGIEHAENIAAMLKGTFGVPAAAVHSKMGEKQRDDVITAFKRGELRCIVNKDVLTTGFDHPPIDLIGMLRPTMSTGLWVQMLGRGTRPFDWYKLSPMEMIEFTAFAGFVKDHCLVLDFAGNTRRLGPINDPVIPKPKGDGKPGDAPVKICEACGAYNHTRATECIVCGEEFQFKTNIVGNASEEELLRSDLPVVEYFDVLRTVYLPHSSKKTGKNSIKIAYYTSNLRTFYDWVTVEGGGFAAKRGRDWFRQRAPVEPPETNAEILFNSQYLREPRRIRVWLNKKYPEVLGAEF